MTTFKVGDKVYRSVFPNNYKQIATITGVHGEFLHVIVDMYIEAITKHIYQLSHTQIWNDSHIPIYKVDKETLGEIAWCKQRENQ